VRLLDLYCGEGGAGTGYARAGFDVVGVDNRPQRRYPFEFVQADAVEFVKEHGHEFDAIHASPPCQRFSMTNAARKATHYPDLIGVTRDALVATGLPYVIENVIGAPLLWPLQLCGTEFNLRAIDDDGTPLYMRRHRLFESNLILLGAGGCRHYGGVQWAGSYDGARRDKDEARNERLGGYTPSKAKQAELLGIDWMTLHGLYQSIPPAYTEHLGSQLAIAIA
jgi:DNA (cytosine-5)-methyltransferase 1